MAGLFVIFIVGYITQGATLHNTLPLAINHPMIQYEMPMSDIIVSSNIQTRGSTFQHRTNFNIGETHVLPQFFHYPYGVEYINAILLPRSESRLSENLRHSQYKPQATPIPSSPTIRQQQTLSQKYNSMNPVSKQSIQQSWTRQGPNQLSLRTVQNTRLLAQQQDQNPVSKQSTQQSWTRQRSNQLSLRTVQNTRLLAQQQDQSRQYYSRNSQVPTHINMHHQSRQQPIQQQQQLNLRTNGLLYNQHRRNPQHHWPQHRQQQVNVNKRPQSKQQHTQQLGQGFQFTQQLPHQHQTKRLHVNQRNLAKQRHQLFIQRRRRQQQQQRQQQGTRQSIRVQYYTQQRREQQMKQQQGKQWIQPVNRLQHNTAMQQQKQKQKQQQQQQQSKYMQQLQLGKATGLHNFKRPATSFSVNIIKTAPLSTATSIRKNGAMLPLKTHIISSGNGNRSVISLPRTGTAAVSGSKSVDPYTLQYPDNLHPNYNKNNNDNKSPTKIRTHLNLQPVSSDGRSNLRNANIIIQSHGNVLANYDPEMKPGELVSDIVYSVKYVMGSQRGIVKSTWAYKTDVDHMGPDEWSKLYPTCAGSRQSPMNIMDPDVVYTSELSPFKFIGFNGAMSSFKMHNNGHTASISVSDNMKVEGGGLQGEYKTANIHFHWSSEQVGSEHAINGIKFPVEMHIVNYASRYDNLTNAIRFRDGLAVFAVFFTIKSIDNPYFRPIASGLKRCRLPGSVSKLERINLERLMPGATSEYFRYYGSLTTPPCHQSVIWTVFDDIQILSASQVGLLKNMIENYSNQEQLYPNTSNNNVLESAAAMIGVTTKPISKNIDLRYPGSVNYITDNYRTLQPNYNRVILTNIKQYVGKNAPVPQTMFAYPNNITKNG